MVIEISAGVEVSFVDSLKNRNDQEEHMTHSLHVNSFVFGVIISDHRAPDVVRYSRPRMTS